MIQVYLSGGFFKSVGGVPWQQYVIERFKDEEVEFFNPKDYYKPWVKEEDDWFTRDIVEIADSAIMFGYMNEENPTGYGLAFEMGMAHSMGLDIIFVNEQKDRKWIMVNQGADFLVDDFEEGLRHLKDAIEEFKSV